VKLRGPHGLDRPAVLAVFLLALVTRLWNQVQLDRHVLGEGYDSSAYYTSAAALLHGRMPYDGDFTFVHPPGIILAGLPSALLGQLTTAHIGYLAAHVMCCVLGAVTCAGVTAIAGQWGLPRAAAVIGGAFLAVWTVAVAAQSVFRLEPLGDVLLVAALGVLGAGQEVSRRRLIVAGVLFGVLVNVKVWWFLPVLVVVALTAVRVRKWAVVVVTAGAAALTAVVIDLPFLLNPGSRMFHSVVSAQLGRPAVQTTPTGVRERLSTLLRLEQLTGVSDAVGRFLSPARVATETSVHVGTLVVCAVFLGVAVLALRTPLGRLAVPLMAAQVVAALATPLYFPFYGDFVGVAAALVLAAGASALPRRGRWLAVVPVACAVGLVLTLTDPSRFGTLRPPDPVRVAAAVGDARCVVSDSPRVLIAINAVQRSLSHGCRNVVDIQAVGHGAGPDPRGQLIDSPAAVRAWRREVTGYFGSGDVLVLSDPNIRYWLGPERLADLTRGRPATRVGSVVVYGPRPVR
jgi:alpha-1,2-mannosyltransferase